MTSMASRPTAESLEIERAQLRPNGELPAEAIRQASDLLGTVPGRVYNSKELEQVISPMRASGRLPRSWSVKRLIRYLETSTPLRALTLTPAPGSAFPATLRYVWGDVSPFPVALSVKPASYLTHGTAVFIHGLTDQIPKTIYVNKEQSEKPSNPGSLTQEGIDRAFRSTPRTSNYQFDVEGYRVVMLNGKCTGLLEVTEIPHGGIPVAVTKLERTLIDISVRPFYAGGVHQVLTAFRSARDRASVNTLIATLKRLDYVYPYHQAIGFYMERAGFPEEQLLKVAQIGIRFDFYLTNRMPNPLLSSRWRVWVPEGL